MCHAHIVFSLRSREGGGGSRSHIVFVSQRCTSGWVSCLSLGTLLYLDSLVVFVLLLSLAPGATLGVLYLSYQKPTAYSYLFFAFGNYTTRVPQRTKASKVFLTSISVGSTQVPVVYLPLKKKKGKELILFVNYTLKTQDPR